MSYCRWSSDDWTSDIYTYQDVHGGWTTWVAGARVVLAEPLPAVIPYPENRPETQEGPGWEAWEAQFHAWYSRHQRVMDMQDEGERVAIDLPHAGERFNDDTPGECADRLEVLRALGYVVPQYAIDQLRAEEAAGYTGYEEPEEG